MKKEDKVMKEFLQEELEKESARIKKEVEQDLSLEEAGPPPELKNKIWKQVEELRRQREAYENLSEADKEALRLGKELQLRREEKAKEEFSEELVPEPLELAAGAEESQLEIQTTQEKQTKKVRVRKRRKKAVVAWAVALVAVLGVGITSFGDGGFMAETVDRMLGGRKTTNINSESDDTDVTQQEEIAEEEVLQRIKDEFGFDPVRMDYKPLNMEMVDYILEPSFLSATLYYQYEENVFMSFMAPVYQDFSFGYDIEDTVVDEYVKTVENVEIQVTEYVIEKSNEQEFSARFEYKDVTYILTGIIKKNEFEKILENLHFF
nr:DUF4367 domain-containing protein [uncultured Sellimonas sp.]